jgi:hypothetical protein
MKYSESVTFCQDIISYAWWSASLITSSTIHLGCVVAPVTRLPSSVLSAPPRSHREASDNAGELLYMGRRPPRGGTGEAREKVDEGVAGNWRAT